MSSKTRGPCRVQIIATFADDSCKKVTIAYSGYDMDRHANRWLARGAKRVEVTVWNIYLDHRVYSFIFTPPRV